MILVVAANVVEEHSARIEIFEEDYGEDYSNLGMYFGCETIYVADVRAEFTDSSENYQPQMYGYFLAVYCKP